MIIKKTASKKPESKKKDECADCPAKDFCDDKKNTHRLSGEKSKIAKKNFEEKHGLNLDELLKNAVEVKEEDLPKEVKDFVKQIKGLDLDIKVEAKEVKIEEKKPTRFCSHCGEAMIEQDAPAEHYSRLLRVPVFIPHEAYDKETGRKRFIKELKCPNFRGETLFRTEKHDRYSIGQPFTK